MSSASLTIATTIDGKETLISPKGTLIESADGLIIDYQDGEAEAKIVIEKGKATISRKGDYGMCLPLVKGERTQGELTIAGSVGKIELFTHLMEYSQKSNKYLITLGYDIFFQGEPQKMQVRILAKKNG